MTGKNRVATGVVVEAGSGQRGEEVHARLNNEEGGKCWVAAKYTV